MKGKETTGTTPASTPNIADETMNLGIKTSAKKRGGARPNSGGKRANTGGARVGAGRKPNMEKLIVKGIQQQLEDHANEIVEVREKIGDKTTIVKKSRRQALMDVLYIEGHNKKNISAIKEYFDRTQGKAKQPVEHSGSIAETEQRVPTPAELKAADAYYETLIREERKK